MTCTETLEFYFPIFLKNETILGEGKAQINQAVKFKSRFQYIVFFASLKDSFGQIFNYLMNYGKELSKDLSIYSMCRSNGLL